MMQQPHPLDLDTRAFVRINTFGEHAPLPQVNIGPRTSQVARAALSQFTVNIQSMASRHPPRIFFTNLMTQNNWQNQECAEALTIVLSAVEMRLATTNGDPIQITIATVDDVVQMLVAAVCMKYQQQIAPYLDQQSINAINQGVQRFNQLRNDLQYFAQASNGQNWGMQQNNYGGGFGAGGGGSYSFAANTAVGTGMGYGQPPNTGPLSGIGSPIRTGAKAAGQSLSGWQETTPVPQHNTGSATRVGPVNATLEVDEEWKPTLRHVTGVDEISSSSEGVKIVTSNREPTPVAPRTITNNAGYRVVKLDAPAAPEPTPAPVVEDEPEYVVTDPENPFKEIKLRDGTIIRDASTSGWTRDRTQRDPYAKAFNPQTHFLVHTRTVDGKVHEVLQKKPTTETEDTMESYEAHELDPALRQRERERRAKHEGKSVIDWSRIIRLKPEDDKPYALEEVAVENETTQEIDSIVFDDTKIVSKVISSTDPKSGLGVVLAENPELNAVFKTHPIEFYGDRLGMRVTIEDLHDPISSLSSITDLLELRDTLAEARKQFVADKEVWDILEERLTEQVNRHLNIGMGIDWTIGSFSEDIQELLNTIGESYGQLAVDALIGASANIIETSTKIEPRDAVDLGENNTIVFVSRYSVTSIPYSFEELQVAYKGTAAISKNVLPEFHTFVRGIFSRTQDYPVVFADRYVRTKDNHWFRLDEALLMEDTYLISDYR